MMNEKNIMCPRCKKEGLIVEKPTVTRVGGKPYRYKKLYVAHYLQNGISRRGKIVNRIQWCYLNKRHIAKLKAKGVITQNVIQNVTQNNDKICVTPNNCNSSPVHQNDLENKWTGRDLNPPLSLVIFSIIVF
jgi:hypothetical protein